MDNFNRNIDDIVTSITRGANSIKQKAMELKRVGNLRYKIYECDREIASLYKELGEKYYKYNKGGAPDISSETVIRQIDFLSDKKKNLEKLLGGSVIEVGEIPATVSYQKTYYICPNCGKTYSEDEPFCPHCGK